jgi:hypothetical protein
MVFREAYEAAMEGILPAKDAGCLTAKGIKIQGKGGQEVVFVLLRQPFTFRGVTKSFY